MGIITMTTLAGVIQIFIPINFWFTIIMFLFGSLLNRNALINLLDYKRHLSRLKSSQLKVFLLLFVVLLGYLLLFASGDVTNGDTYLYHNQNIKWFNEYRLVPGLANMHSRFGFNCNIFTLIASQILPTKPTFYVFNFGLTLLFFWYVLNKFLRKNKFTLPGFFFILYSIWMLRTNVSTPSPDLHVYIFASFLILDVWETLSLKKKVLESQNLIKKVKYWIFLSAFIITVKLSAVIVALIFIPALIYLKRDQVRLLIKPFMLASIIVLVWGLRTFIITGQVVYPLASIYNQIATWSVTKESVINNEVAIKGWAREPGEGYRKASEVSMLEWFPEWWKKEKTTTFIKVAKVDIEDFYISNATFYLLTLVLLFFAILISVIKKRMDIIIFFTILLFMVVFWFITAPDFRFSTFIFGLIFTLSSIELGRNYDKRGVIRYLVLIPSLFLTLNLGVLLTNQLPSFKLAITQNLLKPIGMGYGVDWFTKDFKGHKKINLNKENYYYLADTTYTMKRSFDTLFPSVPQIVHINFLGEDWENGIAPKSKVKEHQD
ncbi:MAG: hypothetical protein COB15_05925 [Flavobacteriales bacterium]|nr:MAG: hypothetical protein COB15_05925 [Flavobacteriales bacterium]